jgi:hypothetical protein
MIGESGNNRREGQGGTGDGLSAKAVWIKGTTVGTRTGIEAMERAIRVLGATKSNRHRKPHMVESDGTGRKFMHLTRGGFRRESAGGVSRGHSSEESPGNREGAKGRRIKREQSANDPPDAEREGHRNGKGVATAAASLFGAVCERGWIPLSSAGARAEFSGERKEVSEDAQ